MVPDSFYLYSQIDVPRTKMLLKQKKMLFLFLVDVVIRDALLWHESGLWASWQGRKRLWCESVTRLPRRQHVESWLPKVSQRLWGWLKPLQMTWTGEHVEEPITAGCFTSAGQGRVALLPELWLQNGFSSFLQQSHLRVRTDRQWNTSRILW